MDLGGGFTSHLECSATGQRLPPGQLYNLSPAGKPLLVRYDLDALGAQVKRSAITRRRTRGFWRYRELLPVLHEKDRITLGEVTTPLVALNRLAHAKGRLLVKDEAQLPTGSFKARGLALAVAMAKQLGVSHLAIPSNGNAGAALAAYAARAGLQATVFCPEDTPEINLREIQIMGARVFRVNGLINDCARIVGEGARTNAWFDVSTLKEPYRIEGKKTMGLELAEQLGWRVPDVIFYPTGGGTGLIGMWKAFWEMARLGWIGQKRPRMVAVQASGCAPIVRAWETGQEQATAWEHASTVAAGIRVPVAIGDFLILRALRESRGFAVAVDDAAILEARREVAESEGLLLCPEGAATYAAWKQALAEGRITSDERVILFNCASGLKYHLPEVTRRLDRHQPLDIARL